MDFRYKLFQEVTCLLFVLISAFGTIHANDHVVCYTNVGCFTNTASCGSAIEGAFPPDHPIAIGTQFLMYTPENVLVPRVISRDVIAEELNRRHFNSSRPTKIIVHGWEKPTSIQKHKKRHKANHHQRILEDRFTGLPIWMLDMKDAFMKEGSYNIILVDWIAGSSNPLYIKAALNTKVVGREIGLLLEYLHQEMALSPSNVHVIGLGLGAHVAGYAGEHLKGEVSRITGLDPSGSLYQDTAPSCRLDKTDAIYVDVIHTDINGLGIDQNIGHVDFYPNGGHNQPTCPPYLALCDHKMALVYFTVSILNTCPFYSFPCVTNHGRTLGVCDPLVGCPTMGAYSNQKFGHGQLCTVVHHTRPYCDRLIEKAASATPRGISKKKNDVMTGLFDDEGSGDSENAFFLRNDFDKKRYKRKGSMQRLLVKLAPATARAKLFG